jgi:hypothetical protein
MHLLLMCSMDLTSHFLQGYFTRVRIRLPQAVQEVKLMLLCDWCPPPSQSCSSPGSAMFASDRSQTTPRCIVVRWRLSGLAQQAWTKGQIHGPHQVRLGLSSVQRWYYQLRSEMSHSSYPWAAHQYRSTWSSRPDRRFLRFGRFLHYLLFLIFEGRSIASLE